MDLKHFLRLVPINRYHRFLYLLIGLELFVTDSFQKLFHDGFRRRLFIRLNVL